MVTTGFSKPYVAKYNVAGSTVTYSGGMKLGRGVNFSLEPEVAEDNDFYVDNVVGETEGAQFLKGTAAVTIDGLEPEAATLILGLPTTHKVGEVDVQGYGDMNPPYVGYGHIRRTQMNGVVKYWPVVHPKVRFSIPKDEAATQEDKIDWQTQELSASVVRDDTKTRYWKLTTPEGYDTEDEAEEVLKELLGITEVSKASVAPAQNEAAVAMAAAAPAITEGTTAKATTAKAKATTAKNAKE